MGIHQLDRAQARRVAVRAQLLDAPRPTDLVEVVQQLNLLQIDPAAAIAPSADLVLWSRLGSSYRPSDLQHALDDRTLVEFNGMVRPMEDVALHLAGASTWPTREEAREWLTANDPFRKDVLVRLEGAGPLLSREIPDTSVVSWPSSGWTNDRNVTQMLEFLVMRGEVAVSGRDGRQRQWDLAERVYPDDIRSPTVEEAQRLKDERRLQSLGIARARGSKLPSEPVDVGEAGEPAVVEGVDGAWRVDPAALESDTRGGDFAGRAALLSPYDRLVYDRVRTEALFDFEYLLEVYKPKNQRRWGYYALPILFGDRLVGKLDAKADRKNGVLEVHAVHRDVAFTEEITRAVDEEIDDLADWLGLTVPR